MPKTFAQKSSYRLFLWGMLLVPFAAVADAVLDAVLFGSGSLHEQIFTPSYHELAARVLFSTFILAAIYLGMHYLANCAQKEASLQQQNRSQELAKQDLEEVQETLLQQLRGSSSELAAAVTLFREQRGRELDERSSFFLDNVGKTSNRLNRQLDTGFAMSELTFGEPQRSQLKIDKLAQGVADKILQSYPDRQIEFSIQPWLSAWCDAKMMRHVLHGLFSNAVESIPASRQGLIEFGAIRRSGKDILFVRDNGKGCNEGQAKRLFDVFGENGQDQGTPPDRIRLANVRRVIHRHGGRVWAEGVPDAGTTIFFTYY